jgi:arylsulfatase A-like enzyme
MYIPRNEGIRTEKWKYIQYIDRVPLYEELYDLSEDPIEAVNLARSREHSAAIEHFRGELIRMRAAAK